MATMRVWAGMEECRDVGAIYQVVKSLRDAAAAAEKAGCKVGLVGFDLGDQQVGVSGPRPAIVEAAREFAERGFTPTVCAGSEAEFEALDEDLVV